MVVVTAAVIERDDGKVLIARRGPGSALAGYWEFPGGKLEPGEGAKECLARELREELGIECEVGDHLVTHEHAYDHITIEMRSYAVRHVAGELVNQEHSELAWVEPNRLLEYDLAPADLPTVEAILRARDSRCGDRGVELATVGTRD